MNLIRTCTRSVAIVGLLALSGCGDRATDVLAMKIELTALKQELELLRQQTEDLDPRIRSAEQMALQAFDERDAPLPLDCARRLPAVLSTRLAALAVACDDIEPVATGYRIRLKVGNPTSARLDGLRLTLYAGDGAARGRSEKRLYREMELSVPPGSWRTVDIELDGLDAASAGNLALRADVAGLQLASR